MFLALQPILYVQISPEQLRLKNLKTGEVIAEVPELAIGTMPNQGIIAFGAQARSAAASQSAVIVNPFAHPRSLV